MHLSKKEQIYVDKEYVFSFERTMSNWVFIKSEIYFLTDKFVDYQKDLISDFLNDFVETLQESDLEILDIKKNFEYALQDLNSKLNIFAEKIKHIEHFFIKGFVEIISDSNYMASLIGDVSVVIFRNGNVNYSLTNTVDKKSKIDLFSDFIEGDIETGDDILFFGTNIDNVFDEQDIEEISSVIKSHPQWLIEFLSDVLLTRISEQQLVSIISQHISLHNVKSSPSSQRKNSRSTWLNFDTWKRLQNIGNTMIQYKYFTIFGVFLCVIFLLSYNLISNFINTDKNNVIVTTSGEVIDINIEDVKKNISAFQRLDASSNEKIVKYKEISDQLNLLQQKNKRPNDVVELKKILQSEYNKGFNIIYVNSVDQLTNKNASSPTDSKIFSFNSQDLSALWDLHSLFFEKELFIAGQNGTIVRAVNNDIRGTLVEYGINTPIVNCNMNISKNGLYCYTANGQIYHILRSWIESVSTKSVENFPSQIQWISTFWRSNMFVLNNNISGQSWGVIMRYQNVIGTQSQFQEGLAYTFASSTGFNFSSGFSSFAVDATFLVWNKFDQNLYQFWRPGAAPTLNIRKVSLFGWDNIWENYSQDVKVLASLSSNYVYLWDKWNQSFTVYSSKGPKTNDANSTNYNLNYMFRLKFDLWPQVKVIDIAVSNNSDKPDAYIMTVQGVFKVPLYEYIESIIANNTVRN